MNELTNPGTLFAFGLNHKTAPVEVREKVYLKEAEASAFLQLVGPELSECMVVSTCNRTEVYGVAHSTDIEIDRFKKILLDLKGARQFVSDEHFFESLACAACQQIFSVATSIDSKVVGDLQILRQLRDAYSIARENRTTGKILNQLLQRALKLGKMTFTQTSIHEGAVSTSLAAVELATQIFGSLRERSVLVLGAGETARLTAEALVNKRVGRLILSNRTRSHAQDLLDSLERTTTQRTIVEFEGFRKHLDEVDILIASTGSELPILYANDVRGLRERLLVIDIAVPRDVAPEVGELPNVVLRNIDDLHSIVEGNHERRLRDIPRVKKLLAKEMVDFLTWYYTLPLMPIYGPSAFKPTGGRAAEILDVKRFLSDNVAEIHRLFSGTTGNFQVDLGNHLNLINLLRERRAAELEA